MAFENAAWIWPQEGGRLVNETADFRIPFSLPKTGKSVLRVCSKSDYACFVGEILLGNNACADFPTRKIYDEIDLTPYAGQTIELFLLVLSKNYETSSSIADGYGLLFEILHEGEAVLSSSPAILSRLDPHYTQGAIPVITGQLGMAYQVDFAAPETPYRESRVSDKKHSVFLPRPMKKLVLSPVQDFHPLSSTLYYGGGERVGYLHFTIEAPEEEELLLAYGEHLVEGRIQSAIGNRNFVLRFRLKQGRNVFFGPLFRLGLAYLEIQQGEGLRVLHLGVVDAFYPHRPFIYRKNPIDQDIVEGSLKTLECCMHDHYEDCPWREQAQYTMDGRTEILLSYLIFHEMALPRNSLLSMSYRSTSSGAFPITSPCATELSIPTFSLFYPFLVQEYLAYSGDLSLVQEVYPKCERMMEHYLSSLQEGVLPMLKEWNFFEWSENLANDEEIFDQKEDPKKGSLGNTCFLLLALKAMASLALSLKKDPLVYEQEIARVIPAARQRFYDGGKGLYADYEKDGVRSSYSEYGQLFAAYSGLAGKEEKETILEILTHPNSLTPLSLNNYLFKYELLLQTNGRYDRFVINEVNQQWAKMIRQPPFTGWESLSGWRDFANAGSLCHGWSAVPLYVYHIFEERMAESQQNTSGTEAIPRP